MQDLQRKKSGPKLAYILAGLAVLAVCAVVAVGGAAGLVLLRLNSSAPLNVKTYEDLGRDHVAEGSTRHVAYNSVPPTSGPHWPQWETRYGVLKEQVPDERQVHN